MERLNKVPSNSVVFERGLTSVQLIIYLFIWVDCLHFLFALRFECIELQDKTVTFGWWGCIMLQYNKLFTNKKTKTKFWLKKKKTVHTIFRICLCILVHISSNKCICNVHTEKSPLYVDAKMVQFIFHLCSGWNRCKWLTSLWCLCMAQGVHLQSWYTPEMLLHATWRKFKSSRWGSKTL